jgi:NAD(P)H-dependent flavin oxidoreductase YrpB (nitropropane dioxygenase family)
LDKEDLSFLCQETYAEEKIAAAITKGKDALIAALRTPNMYPSRLFANKIAEAVLTMYGPEPSPSSEVVLDDVDFIIKQRVKRKLVVDIDDNATGIEDVLDDDIEEDFDEKAALKKINSPLKIVDDEYEDFDDDEK